MSSQSNSFESLISSFKEICSALEEKAEHNLKEVEKECEEEFASSVKALQRFDHIISGLSKTCSEVVINNEILKQVTVKSFNKNSITLPYEMHSDIVKCFKELYNMSSAEKDFYEGKLINEKNKQSIDDLVKVAEKNINELRDIENTLVEAIELY